MTEPQIEKVVHASNAQSQESLGNGSSHWSVSTLSQTGEGDLCTHSITENSNSKTKEGKCWSVRKLLQFVFQWKKSGTPAVVDKFQLLADLTNYINLMDAFIKQYLTPKLEVYLKEIYFSKACGNLCLPAAQVWTATYLLNLHMKPIMDPEPESVDPKKMKTFRRLLLSLCWEMEVTKKVSYQFYTRFQKFTSDLNHAFKRLRSTLLSATGSKETLDFHVLKNLELNLKKDRVPIVLDIKSNLSQNFPFSLSVDTKSTNDEVLSRNQDFLKLKSEVQEEILTSFLNSAVLSLETCYSILESSHERISSRGIIKKEESNGYKKDLTCYNALRRMTSLLVQLASAKLEESEIAYLYTSISGLLDKWNEYVGFAQEVILSFYELSDMITICYSFARHEIKLSIPDLVSVQKEVSVKQKFENKSEKSRSRQLDLKEYAVEALLEECVERQNSENSIGNAKSSVLKMPLVKDNNSVCIPYHNAMLSTRYPLFIQQYPLEVLSKRGQKYFIVFRPVPDLERIDSGMMLSEHTTVASTKIPTSHDNIKSLKCLQLETFQKIEIQLND